MTEPERDNFHLLDYPPNSGAGVVMHFPVCTHICMCATVCVCACACTHTCVHVHVCLIGMHEMMQRSLLPSFIIGLPVITYTHPICLRQQPTNDAVCICLYVSVHMHIHVCSVFVCAYVYITFSDCWFVISEQGLVFVASHHSEPHCCSFPFPQTWANLDSIDSLHMQALHVIHFLFLPTIFQYVCFKSRTTNITYLQSWTGLVCGLLISSVEREV